MILTQWKIIFIHTQLVKKNYYEKFNIFTSRIVLPEINLWFYTQLCKAELVKVW